MVRRSFSFVLGLSLLPAGAGGVVRAPDLRRDAVAADRSPVEQEHGVVDDLFELSRIHAGVLNLAPEALSVGDLIRTTSSPVSVEGEIPVYSQFLGAAAAGGTFFRIPPQANLQFRTGFNLTPKWAASWSTNYDFQRSEFGMQSVTLQRELHDWRAVFGFTQAPNGAFTFTFFVALKAEPDLKFDYNKSTYPGQTLPSSR